MQALELRSVVAKAVAALPAPVFFAGLDGGKKPCVTLHTAKPEARRDLRRAMRGALSAAGIDAYCRVKAYKPARLRKARSLSRLTAGFAHETALFDPTGCVQRAQAVVRCAGALRETMGGRLRGVYLHAASRTLYVVLRRDGMMVGGKLEPSRRLAVEGELRRAMIRWQASEAAPLLLALQVGFAPPRVPVVAVDEASLPNGGLPTGLLGALRSGSIVAGLAALFGVGLAGSGKTEGPAVSETNVFLDARGGIDGGDGAGVVTGTLTVPLGFSFGASAEAAGGVVGDGDGYWGIGGNAFWRDPDVGLLGIFGSYQERDDADRARFGARGSWYLDRLTLSGRFGYQTGDAGDGDDGAFGRVLLRWYATDNFAVHAGGEIEPDDDYFTVGAEFQPGWESLPGLSIFADGEYGGDDSRTFVGVRYYFAQPKTLIDRHRKDIARGDPELVPVPPKKDESHYEE